MIANFMEIVQKFIGSSTLLRAHGMGGASATIFSVLPPEKSAGGFQQAGKKEGGWGGGGKRGGGGGKGFLPRRPTARRARLGWERLRSLAPPRLWRGRSRGA